MEHIQFDEEHALESGEEDRADGHRELPESRARRSGDPEREGDTDLIAGFTAENTYQFLGGRYRATYRPLNNAIIEGRIRGLAGVVGCNNPNISTDFAHLEMVKELIRNDVLVVQTGCSAIACAKAGLLAPRALTVCRARACRRSARRWAFRRCSTSAPASTTAGS